MHARQWYDDRQGQGYSPVKQPLTPSLLRAHLEGSITLGVYPVRLDGTVTFLALDLDISRASIDAARGDLERTRTLRRAVHRRALLMGQRLEEEFGIKALIEDSGYKGRHLWIFLREPIEATLAHRVCVALAGALAPPAEEGLHIEAFPKQGRIRDDGYGNLIKLPLGIHLRSSRRTQLLDAQGNRMEDPWPLLQQVERYEREHMFELLTMLRDVPRELEPAPHTQAVPMPAPLSPPAVFTEVDFATHPEVSVMMNRCAVLAALKERALERRRLDHDERTVLRHTLGHIPGAIPAVNYLFERCPEVSPTDYLQSVLKSHPMSCPKIRKRIPDLTSQLPCHCAFPTRPEHYPTPVLHLDEARARGELVAEPLAADAAVRPMVIEDLVRTYTHLEERAERLAAERDAARSRLVDALAMQPERALQTAQGRWLLVDEQGLPVIRWEGDEPDEQQE